MVKRNRRRFGEPTRSRSASKSYSRKRQKPCTWKEVVEVARNLPLPEVAEEDLVDQVIHPNSSDDFRTKFENSPSVHSIRDDEVRNLDTKVAKIL